MSGRINQLLIEGRITNVMATSLINDSEQASRIIRNLIDIATLLYHPRDRLVDELEEERSATA
jgi:phosphate:Na+ symporter